MLSDLHARLRAVGIEPCGDSLCIFGAPSGMRTNGGCQCAPAGDLTTMRRVLNGAAAVLRGYAKEHDTQAVPHPMADGDGSGPTTGTPCGWCKAMPSTSGHCLMCGEPLEKTDDR